MPLVLLRQFLEAYSIDLPWPKDEWPRMAPLDRLWGLVLCCLVGLMVLVFFRGLKPTLHVGNFRVVILLARLAFRRW